jgi:hypothetical protein
VKTPSQCERVLAVLEDGQPHDIQEIHRLAGTMRLNSRVAELRTRGHEIVCTREGETYRYQLVLLGEPESEGAAPSSSGSPSEDGTSTLSESADCKAAASLDLSGESRATDRGRTGDGSPDTPEQLALDVAA